VLFAADGASVPVGSRSDPYKPTNGPAIGDLMDLFKFP
jgi:hypothetical protein